MFCALRLYTDRGGLRICMGKIPFGSDCILKSLSTRGSGQDTSGTTVVRTWHGTLFKLSVGVTCHPYLLEIEGLFTEGWRPGRTVGESVGGILEMDSSD